MNMNVLPEDLKGLPMGSEPQLDMPKVNQKAMVKQKKNLKFLDRVKENSNAQ